MARDNVPINLLEDRDLASQLHPESRLVIGILEEVDQHVSTYTRTVSIPTPQ